MYMQKDILAASPNGPHLADPKIDPALRRSEIEQVIAAATAAMPKAAMRKLGAFSFATAAEDDGWDYFGQLRSEPVGASGLEFRFPFAARHTGRHDLDQVSREMVVAATHFAKVSRKLQKYAAMVREDAERAIAPAVGGIATIRIAAIGVTPGLPGASVRTTVDVEMLGCDLKPCIDRASDADHDRLEAKLTKLAALHVTRRKALAQASVMEASGWIDGAARLILAEAGIGVADIVGRLDGEPEVEFHFGGDEGYDLTGAVYWVDGTIKGFVEDRTRGATFRLQTDQLTIESANLPATIIAGLVGRRLRDVVDLRFIPDTAIIVDVQESDPWLYLDLEIGRSTIEEAIAAG